MIVHLHIVNSCLHATTARVVIDKKDPQNLKYYLAFYRKSLPTPGLEAWK